MLTDSNKSGRKTTGHSLRLSIALVFFLLVACGGGVYHTVKPGQNLYRISRAYDVDKDYLARVNGISDPSMIKAGTRLYIPGASQVKYVPQVESSSPSTKTAPSKTTAKKPTNKPTNRPVAVKKPAAKSPPASRSNATNVSKLSWPLRGKIVRSFSLQAKAGSGKGIEIAVRSGSVVKAAEAGKTIYSGNGVKGYGHLIILQHENDLFTVYGFNQQNLVREGDFVSQGEKIALSGTPPAGGQARLHFEVRKGKVAVDPILYLP